MGSRSSERRAGAAVENAARFRGTSVTHACGFRRYARRMGREVGYPELDACT
jgi:hypothetical protein